MTDNENTKTEGLKRPGDWAAFFAGLFWGPLGVILAAIRSNHPHWARDERTQNSLMDLAWIGAMLQSILLGLALGGVFLGLL